MSQVYTARQLAPGLFGISEGGGVWLYLLEGEGEALLVDTGFGGGDLPAFLATLTSQPVTRVVITHADGDHLGAVDCFEKVYLHPAEFDRYAAGGKRDCSRLLPTWEGDEFTVGGRTWTVVLLPGHTPGSIALLDCQGRALIAGDTVQNDAVYMFGPGRNIPAFVHSMDKLMAMSDRFDAIYCGHGDSVLTPDILPALKQGALDVAAGKIPSQPPHRPLPCRLYDCGRVKFLYQPPEG